MRAGWECGNSRHGGSCRTCLRWRNYPHVRRRFKASTTEESSHLPGVGGVEKGRSTFTVHRSIRESRASPAEPTTSDSHEEDWGMSESQAHQRFAFTGQRDDGLGNNGFPSPWLHQGTAMWRRWVRPAVRSLAAFRQQTPLPNTIFNLLASRRFDLVLVPQIVRALKR